MSIPCSSFYSRRRRNTTGTRTIYPQNPTVSEGESSSSEEEYDSDADPEWVEHKGTGIRSNNIVTDSDEETEEYEAASKKPGPPCKKKKIGNAQCAYKWEKKDIPTIRQERVLTENDTILLTPLQYFNMFFTPEMISYIVHQTNLYSVQCNQVSISTDENEIRYLLSIFLHMGVVSLPSYEDYWAGPTKVPQIAEIMPLKRFKKLRRFIHFCSNEEVKNSADRFAKVRPILNMLRDQCLQIKEENKFSCDETMIPYKGTRAGNLRQYIASKPHKWGFKFFVRAGVSGFIYDFIPYSGKCTFNDPVYAAANNLTFGLGEKIIITLCNTITHPSQSTVYFDNFFTSIQLLSYLYEQKGLRSLGTLRSNRLRSCPIDDDKTLIKRGRGSFDYSTNNNDVIVVKWADNKCVTLASTASGVEPVATVLRYDKIEKKKVQVQCPQIVKQYNEHMGGVDLSNMFIELYRTPTKAKRWYLPIFGYIIDVAVSNAWILYRRDVTDLGIQKYMPLKVFRCLISEGLRTANKPRRGRPTVEEAGQSPKVIRRPVIARPVDDSRYDQIGHFPIHAPKGRCRFCTNGSGRVQCMKCKVMLCFNSERNCFLRFHTKNMVNE